MDVDIQEILAVRALNYTWTKISEIVGISTLYRRLHNAGISTELDGVIQEMKSQFPSGGVVI